MVKEHIERIERQKKEAQDQLKSQEKKVGMVELKSTGYINPLPTHVMYFEKLLKRHSKN